MPLGEEYGEEVQGAIFGVILSLYVGFLAPALAQVTESPSIPAC